MRKIAISVLVGLMTVTSMGAVSAADCGFPPMNKPSVPDGKTATRVIINATVGALKSYGDGMNTYLDCMTENQDKFFDNMTKKQQERWNDDFNNYMDELETVQNSVNRVIRLFNLNNKVAEEKEKTETNS